MELRVSPSPVRKPSLILQQYSKAMFFALSFTLALIDIVNMLKYPTNNLIIVACVSQCGIILKSLIKYEYASWKTCSNIYIIGLTVTCIFGLAEQNLMCVCACSYLLGRILNYHYLIGRLKHPFKVFIISIVLAHLSTGGCPIALFPIIYGVFHCNFLSDVIYKANLDMSDKLEELLQQDKNKDTCFAALIHELRNPLTT